MDMRQNENSIQRQNLVEARVEVWIRVLDYDNAGDVYFLYQFSFVSCYGFVLEYK